MSDQSKQFCSLQQTPSDNHRQMLSKVGRLIHLLQVLVIMGYKIFSYNTNFPQIDKQIVEDDTEDLIAVGSEM